MSVSVCLYCLSILPALQTDISMASCTITEELRFIRGRTQSSRNAIYGGYQYGNPSQLKSGHLSWGCIRKTCTGRIYTISDTHVDIVKEHNHEPDVSHCNVKLAINSAKDQAVSSASLIMILQA